MRFFDEEIEELYWERIEEKMPVKEMEKMREKYDKGWNDSKVPEKLALIIEDTQGIIDKRYLK